MIRRRPRRPFKPFSVPSWVVGRDFPDPNTPPPGTVPNGPAGFTESIPIPHPPTPTPTPPLYPEEGRAANPLQSAAAPAPIPAAEAPSQQPPARKPGKKRPSASFRRGGPFYPEERRAVPPAVRPPSDATLHPPISSIQNNYHSGKCSIRNHPDRAEIEAAFLNWEPAERIVAEFNLPARSTLYRHAKAADLVNQRRNNLRAALDQIIEQAGRVSATASSVISAIELSYRLSGANVAPVKRYETTHIYVHDPNPPSNAGCQPAPVPQSTPPENGSNGTAACAPAVRPPSDAGLSADSRRGGCSSPPGFRPPSDLQQQSGHQNIVAPSNSLIPNEDDHKQSGHTRVPTRTKTEASAMPIRVRRRCRFSRGDSGGRCGTGLAGGRLGFCCRWRGAGLRGSSRLPIARGSCLRGVTRGNRLGLLIARCRGECRSPVRCRRWRALRLARLCFPARGRCRASGRRSGPPLLRARFLR